MSLQPLATTSFKTPYVSLDLLLFLKSRQVTPFQIFNEVIMPDFQDHISKGNINNKTSCGQMQMMLKKIQDDLIPISEACAVLQHWEDGVSCAVEELALQSVDDAFKERTGKLEHKNRSEFMERKLERIDNIVSKLKGLVCEQVKLSSVALQIQHNPKISGELEGLTLQETEVIYKETEKIYKDLGEEQKRCFLCFSVFPEDAVIKKKVLIHWWVGEELIDTSVTGGKTAEEKASEFFKEFVDKGLLEPFYKKRRPNADSCKMKPATRSAVIELAEREKFFNFDPNGNPTVAAEDLACSERACLVRTVEGSNVRDLPLLSRRGNVKSLINVNEPNLYFRPKWFSGMKNVKVLQLGRWQSSAKQQLIEAEDCEFLKGLKNMKQLRYLSLRGVSKITELPASICKLSNLRILNLNGCCDLEKLPKGIGSLKNLTHLDMYECYLLSQIPKGLSSLSQLQVLKGFVISKPGSGSQACKLADLSKLKNLKKLSIHIDKKLAADTTVSELNSLTELTKLQSLSISWSRIYGKPIKPVKLPSLKKFTKPAQAAPSSTIPVSPFTAALEKLNLHNYNGSHMPDWLKPQLLSKLKKLYIRGGSISEMCHKYSIGCKWNVEMLRLKMLPQLQMDWKNLQDVFPKLSYLEIFECPKLKFDQCDENGVWKREDSEQDKASSSNAC